MKPPSLLPPLFLPLLINACMEFSGTFPFSHSAPFSASITDNGITTCWISTSLDEHNAYQHALSEAEEHHREHGDQTRKKPNQKRAVGSVIRLSSQSAYDPNHTPDISLPNSKPLDPANEKSVDLAVKPAPRFTTNTPSDQLPLPQTAKMQTPSMDDMPLWQPWEFSCLPGYKARGEIGLRGFTYVAHGQEFFFVPETREDLEGERWVYELWLWCQGKDGRGKGKVGKESGTGKESVMNGGSGDRDGGKKDGGDGKKSTDGGNGMRNRL
ncbi:uncharacterized protein RAG0_10671 [Rhynchosporium agropyri]|uniref:Uncharacterized protein n=1 Tax=Rhynchosporium agropyri TaxID=914238 RepID=A0A1E1L0S6_9HELO|nr:uncharacterized protein RAG0_10671 [Rhynchosporium agropyri]